MSKDNKKLLYEVPRGSTILFDGKRYTFHHADGTFSLCFDKNNEVVHLSAWSEVEIVENEDE